MALPTPISCGGFPDRFIDRPAVDVDGSNTYATAAVSRVDLAVRLARWPFVSEDTSAFITALLDGRVIPRAQLEEMMDRVDWGVAGPDFSYGLGLAGLALPCGVTMWGHPGDLPGYNSIMMKALDGPAVSVTFTQFPVAHDPRLVVLEGGYCAAAHVSE